MIPNSRSAVGRQNELMIVDKPASNPWLKPGWQESGALCKALAYAAMPTPTV